MRNEKGIVNGILSDDERALRKFYRYYAPFVAKFVRLRVSNEKDVEEIVQDSLLASIEALRDFTFQCRLSTFVCSIAKRKVVDHYRKKRFKKLVRIEHTQIETVLSVLTSPERRLDDKLLTESIERAFADIRPRYRRLLTLKYIEGLSVSEIADELSMTFKSVESMLFRARKAFVGAYGQ